MSARRGFGFVFRRFYTDPPTNSEYPQNSIRPVARGHQEPLQTSRVHHWEALADSGRFRGASTRSSEETMVWPASDKQVAKPDQLTQLLTPLLDFGA